jgi:GNAT superfamily N-acetyltransferase/predicted nucleic acid-binding protein
LGVVKISILRGCEISEEHLATIIRCADSERHALGFLPKATYLEHAVEDRLYVATALERGQDAYAGHLLFGGVYPFMRVFQVYVSPKYRRQKVGSRLIQALVREAEDSGYLSISARVADDLREANAFWSHEGFELMRTRPARSPGRHIHVRVKDLDTPRLFAAPQTATAETIQIAPPSPPASPLYVIDVNVFLDLVKSRPGAADTERLIAAAWNRSVELHVAEEFVNELKRSPLAGGNDPVLQMAMALPRLPKVPEPLLAVISKRLQDTLFPDRQLHPHDTSDLRHLATAIHHGASGFVTGEKQILKRRAEINRQFGLDVVGAAELVEFTKPMEVPPEWDVRSTSGGDAIEISEMLESDREEVARFLCSLGEDEPTIRAALSPGSTGAARRRMKIRSTVSQHYLALASWNAPHKLRRRMDVFVFVDEDHPDAPALAHELFAEMLRDAVGLGPILITLCTPEGHQHVRLAAMTFGFRSELSSTSSLQARPQKVAIGGVVASANWRELKNCLAELTGIHLSATPPAFQGPETKMSLTDASGRIVAMALTEFEQLLSPALFLLPGRAGLAVPIRRRYAEHLFPGSAQLPLTARGEAGLSVDRVYFCSPRNSNSFFPGAPVLFYESQYDHGRGAMFACATVRSARSIWADTVSKRYLRKGVLDEREIQRMARGGLVSMFHFENILLFRQPVSLKRLRDLGCADGANFVTARRLATADLESILTEAKSLAL